MIQFIDLDKKIPIKVCVTGAAGQIAYSLLLQLANGSVFGYDQPIILHLLDIPNAMESLHGLVMELEDCAFPLLQKIVATDELEVAFQGIDWAILLGAMPRREGMQRNDLLKANVGIFEKQGRALDLFAKKSVRVVVVGNPANTNALIASLSAPSIPKEQFSALTRLDHNRAIAIIARKLEVPIDSVKNVCIWGNHSNTQVPDLSFAEILTNDGVKVPLLPKLSLDERNQWIQNEFIPKVAQRGAEIIKARKLSSALSAAKAIADHIRSWVFGTEPNEFVSMAVRSDGTFYGIPNDLMVSVPVTIQNGRWKVIENLRLSENVIKRLTASIEELETEKKDALCYINLI